MEFPQLDVGHWVKSVWTKKIVLFIELISDFCRTGYHIIIHDIIRLYDDKTV